MSQDSQNIQPRKWINLTIRIENSDPMELCDLALELGALSATIHDDSSTETASEIWFDEPGHQNYSAWNNSIVTLLLDEQTDIDGFVKRIQTHFALKKPPAFQVDFIEDRDWVEYTQRQYQPFRINKRLWIVPIWHTPPDPTAVNVFINPGLAFGTGSHPTTLMCLEWLVENLTGGETVLDYGCGSGILGIAAKMLGAKTVTCVDIDKRALDVTRQNANLNHCDLVVGSPDQIKSEPFDVLVANILANPLKELAPTLSALVKIGGHLILSGILEDQSSSVESAYRSFFEFGDPVINTGWVRLEGIKK
ncbi:MAG: 50S ribosomal protein L11 methyltransferase [FCB group bacterium]|nr:50S ribosomal protein L11 methyltransferase [FCB group bacterium]